MHDMMPSLLSDATDSNREALYGVVFNVFAARVRGSCGLLPGSPEEVASKFDAQGARAVASLFRSLRQPSMRVACLSELTGTDVFGNEELELLLQYMRVVCPMSLTRYVQAMTESEGFTTEENLAERVFRRPIAKKKTGLGGTVIEESGTEVLDTASLLKQVAPELLDTAALLKQVTHTFPTTRVRNVSVAWMWRDVGVSRGCASGCVTRVCHVGLSRGSVTWVCHVGLSLVSVTWVCHVGVRRAWA